MKSSITGPRNTANLSEAIHGQLNMYAIAAGAAGVGVLALAQPVEAKIVYIPAHVRISQNEQYNLDINNDGVTDFALVHGRNSYRSKSGEGFAEYLHEKPATGNVAIGRPPAALTRGAVIGNGDAFYHSTGVMALDARRCHRHDCHQSSGGNWRGVTNRYLGLEFQIDGKGHYGWARLDANVGGATLTGYAYETIPGKSIKAGQKKEAADGWDQEDFGTGASLTAPISDKPQAASLAMLALGAQGVPLWRRREYEPVVQDS